ncbi:MAG: transporter ATP-binding protein [Clostridia bacterium]|jgi:ATP-binding cassette subfamily B protein|nr:transporter ATP-binding protein [Clostridia bacterium]
MTQKVGKKKPFLLMWRIIKYTPFLYFSDTAAWVVIHASPLIPGLLAKEFFDMLSSASNVSNDLLKLLALIAVTALVRAGFIYSGARLDILFRFKASSLIQRNLLETLMNRPGALPTKASIGEILNSFRDDARQIEDAVDWIIDVIGTLVFAVIAVVILISIDAKITFFVFTPLVAVIVMANKASRRIEENRRKSRKASAEVNGMAGEIFNSVQAVKVLGAEEHIIRHFHTLNNKRHKLMLKDTLFTQLLESIYQNTVSLGTGLILLLASQSMRAGSFSVGDFAVFVYYLAFVTDFTQFYGRYIAHYQQTCVSFQRVADLMEEMSVDKLVEHNPLYIKEKPPVQKVREKSKEDELESLEVKSLTYHYQSSGGGISDISFRIKKHSFTVVCGKIGSGKTTLLRTILGLLPAESGEVLWNGQHIEDPSEFFVYPRSAYTAQVPHLLSDTVRENILLGRQMDETNMDKAVYSAVLENDIDTFENGLETVVGPRGVKLSGGQAQRVAAARMFARDAELLVFDDISSALDVETEGLLWERTFEHRNKTCLVVSNRKTALMHADNIIVLNNGRIEAEGSLEDLQQSCETIRQIMGK